MFETSEKAYGRFVTNISQYGLLDRPTPQGTQMITANKGALTMAVSEISRGFDESLEGVISKDIDYNPLERSLTSVFWLFTVYSQGTSDYHMRSSTK